MTTQVSRPGDPGVALVVGGSRGLGLSLARQLAERGYRLALMARDESELVSAAEDLARRGVASVRTVACDVADHQRLSAAVTSVEETFGPIEVVFSVAGVIQVGPLDALNFEHFDEAVDVMLWGPINTACAVLPAMRRRGRGRIGVVTSVGGVVAAPHLLPYSTAKFGAVGFARGLRSELTDTGITVTTIVPGLMRTGSHQRALFTGAQGEEYAWFAPAAGLPLLSMNPDRAARAMIKATLAGRSDLLLTPLTQLASRVAALSPRVTAAVLGWTVRALPAAPQRAKASGTVEGTAARRRLGGRARGIVDLLTRLGDRQASRLGEHR